MAATEPLAHTADPPGVEHDPVCGMSVDPATAAYRAEHAGNSYYFAAPDAASGLPPSQHAI